MLPKKCSFFYPLHACILKISGIISMLLQLSKCILNEDFIFYTSEIDRSRRYILDLKLNNFSFLLTLSSKSKKVHIYEKGKLHTIGLEDLNIPLALSYACTKISEKCNLSPMRLSEGVQKIPAYLKKY